MTFLWKLLYGIIILMSYNLVFGAVLIAAAVLTFVHSYWWFVAIVVALILRWVSTGIHFQ